MDASTLMNGIRQGDQRALARGISWVENQHPQGLELLKLTGKKVPLIGITGAPGAGKSSLVNALVSHWVSKGYRVAIL
ncbi:MAG: methylmalonyl Co-A mutase-associated GTPase MeaB, partial [Bacteroidia bacterium]